MLEATLRGLTQALQQGIFAEQLHQRTGWLQSLDPRVKAIIVLQLLVSISLARNAGVIGALYFLILLLAWRSAINPVLLLKRVWLAMPFFTVPIAVPALFLTPGAPAATLPFGLIVTVSGASTVLLLLLRVAASLTVTLLLIYTTAWNTVLAALTSLGLPGVFALMLGMTYRYIYLLLRVAQDMFLSRQSRVVGDMPTAEGQHVVAAAAGTLLAKSFKLSEDVYLAMQSRGFRGSMTSLSRFRMQTRDWAALILLTLIAATSVWAGR